MESGQNVPLFTLISGWGTSISHRAFISKFSKSFMMIDVYILCKCWATSNFFILFEENGKHTCAGIHKNTASDIVFSVCTILKKVKVHLLLPSLFFLTQPEIVQASGRAFKALLWIFTVFNRSGLWEGQSWLFANQKLSFWCYCIVDQNQTRSPVAEMQP